MANIVPIVEGTGEKSALPNLCHKILHEMERYDISVSVPIVAKGKGNITHPGGLEKFLDAAFRDPNCAATLVLLDADDACALRLAESLSKRVNVHGALVPVVIVAAKCEYEAWFLASLPTIAGKSIGTHFVLPADTVFDGDPEAIQGVKGWITAQLPMVNGRRKVAYNEVEDQLAMTRLIDVTLARNNSRSFRRLCHAIEQIVEAIDNNTIVVTP